ncbi:MAG TPA: HAD family hydrolase, partial [Verrucomicrobiae bacterium]|nr:HAD family hydrolase [Verrucomicrobiae bacterium]
MFDLDDTLFPESSYVRSGFEAVSAWLERTHDVQGFCLRAERLFESGARGNIFNLALTELGIPSSQERVSELVKIYREHIPSLHLHPDADWALARASACRRVGLLTDGYLIAQKRKVAALQLEGRVAAIIYSDFYGRDHWKPSPTPYCKLVEALQCRHSDCVYISDNPIKDFL